jgi:hypothetical protein
VALLLRQPYVAAAQTYRQGRGSRRMPQPLCVRRQARERGAPPSRHHSKLRPEHLARPGVLTKRRRPSRQSRPSQGPELGPSPGGRRPPRASDAVAGRARNRRHGLSDTSRFRNTAIGSKAGARRPRDL